MRLAVLSDLHVEFEGFDPPAGLAEADVIVLAGDIHNGIEAVDWARRAFPVQRIVQVAGNHEFFGTCWQETVDHLRAAARRLQVDFLDNDSVTIDGVRFLGATLWTDFACFSVPGRPHAMDADTAMARCLPRIIDFSVVRHRDAEGIRNLTPQDSAGLHRASRQWLARQLDLAHPGPTVVVSHHLPSFQSVAPGFMNSLSNAAFASDLDDLVARTDLWIHGHTHHGFDYRIGRGRVVANPRGYPMPDGRTENPLFDPALIVTV